MFGPGLYHQKNLHTIEGVKKAILSAFPAATKNGDVRLEIANVTIPDVAPLGFQAQQKAREHGTSITLPITATLKLYRKDQGVEKLVEERTMKIGDLPVLTRLGTFLVNGIDYFTPYQMRLKPGMYTREMANGQFETFINVKGQPMRLWMEPGKGIIKFEFRSTNVDIVPILRLLGVSDAALIEALGGERGKELFARNVGKDGRIQLERLLRAILERTENRELERVGILSKRRVVDDMNDSERVQALKEWLGKHALDAFTTRKSLGQEFTELSPQALLAGIRKLVAVSRRDEPPTDRDAPEFKAIYGVEDILPERLQYWLSKRGIPEVLARLQNKEVSLARAIPRDWLNASLLGFFGMEGSEASGLAHSSEAANPLAILSEHTKVTLMGEGGIGDERAVSMNARLFRPSASSFIDPVHTPEGSNIGVVTHVASSARKVGNTLVSKMAVVENGKLTARYEDVTLEQASDSVIGFPEYWDFTTREPRQAQVRAVVKGEIRDVDPKQVQFVIPSGHRLFDFAANAALFFHHTHPNRGMMAGKHITQALPLVYREKPLSDIVMGPANRSVLDELALPFVVRSRVAGTVTKVSNDVIEVTTDDGRIVRHELLDYYPMQAKVGLTHIPVVKVGQRVKEHDLLADTNYTKDGKLALGVNVRTAYTPWKNAGNFEDAIVISESAAKKFSSEHIHRVEFDVTDKIIVSKDIAFAHYPTYFKDGNWEKLDDDGVIKPGSDVKPGDVLIAAVAKNAFDKYDRSAKNLSEIHRSLVKPYINKIVTWDEDFPGTVYRVVRQPKVIVIHIRTIEPARVGDKLSMSSAAKGTIAQVVPDHLMPRDSKGRHIEVILNPHGVAGRINPSQTIEQAVGKLVRDHGITYDHQLFDGTDHAKKVSEMLKSVGDSHAEKLFDPETGRWTEEPVATGYNYMFKLDHPVRKKFSARERDGYTIDETPTSGKGRGGQSYDQLTTYALLGHNAHAILGESFGIRGVKNEDFWIAFQAGETPPPPKVPFIFEKFRAMLNAAGVDTKQHGNVLHYMPMTEKRVLELSRGAIEKPGLLRARGSKDLDIVEDKGGLFDPSITGGLKGESWAHIELPERVPHPLYEKVIRDITDLTMSEYYGLVSHTMYLDPKTGEISKESGPGKLTGEEAFKKILSFNVDDKISEVKRRLRTAVASDANRLNRAHRYLLGLKESGLTPEEAYLTKYVPVLPPKYRPIIEMSDGRLRVADANLLYRDVLMANNALKSSLESKIPDSFLKDIRLDTYKAFGALVGVNNALTHRDDRTTAQGFIDIIKGKANKFGLFQRMLARRRNDYTGRSTIDPDANIGIDEIGIPDDMAWKIYAPVVVRRMVQSGWKPADAVKEVEQRTPAAEQALEAEMRERPVLYNRAPSLHRWSISAALPFRVPGKEIKISPLVVGPFNADFDGDTMSVIVPITEAAKREAFHLLPSRNLRYERDKSLAYGVEKDVITGIFALTKPGADSGRTFETEDEAIQAYHNVKNNLRLDSLVQIKGAPNKQAIGWLIFKKIVPERFLKGLSPPIDGKKLTTIVERIADQSPADFNMLVRRIAQAGFNFAAAKGGITTTVDELVFDRTKVDRLISQMEADVRAVREKNLPTHVQNDEIRKIYNQYVPEINRMVSEHLKSVDHGYAKMLDARMSGKVNPDQFRQILVSPLIMTDVYDNIVPAVIKSGYGRGMSPSDYILTTPGARKGMVARSLATAQPGFLAKELAAAMGPMRIVEKDCGTQHGIELPLSDPRFKNYDADLLDRHLLKDIPGTPYKRNDPVTPEMLSTLRDRGFTSIWVRSPMTCESLHPPCQMCAGRDALGNLHPIGSNIGYNYGQSISERSTQLIMRAFHSGGTLGSGDSLSEGFTRFRELIAVPETVRDQGVLADVDGVIQNVREAPQGGWYIDIATSSGLHQQYAPAGRKVLVKIGDQVKLGDPLTDGNYRPQEIAQKKGLFEAQKYVVEEARKAYQHAGATVRRPVLETMAAGLMRYMKITDDGGEYGVAIGDVLPENVVRKLQQKNPNIRAVPEIPGLSMKPLLSKDLLERLNFQRLEDAIREVPAVGGTSDLTGTSGSPIPGLAYGIAFRPGQAAFELHDSAFEPVHELSSKV